MRHLWLLSYSKACKEQACWLQLRSLVAILTSFAMVKVGCLAVAVECLQRRRASEARC